jgi:ABC-type multidrug transport system ATPase subunit
VSTWHVPRGSAFGYLGPNGAGKTTLIRMLLGLTGATAGTMRLLGRPVPSERALALARVGAIVEEPRFHGRARDRASGSGFAARRHDPPATAVQVDVVALDLAGSLVLVEIERAALVCDLELAFAPADCPE